MDWPVITEETPLEEVQRIHKQIWDYVIEYGEKPYTPYRCDCALCEYAAATRNRLNEIGFACSFCSAATNNNRYCLGGLFVSWLDALSDNNQEKAKYIAKQIRDIPFKTSQKIQNL